MSPKLPMCGLGWLANLAVPGVGRRSKNSPYYHYLLLLLLLLLLLSLGGSCVVTSRVVSPRVSDITFVILITPLLTAHVPPSTAQPLTG